MDRVANARPAHPAARKNCLRPKNRKNATIKRNVNDSVYPDEKKSEVGKKLISEMAYKAISPPYAFLTRMNNNRIAIMIDAFNA